MRPFLIEQLSQLVPKSGSGLIHNAPFRFRRCMGISGIDTASDEGSRAANTLARVE